MVDEKIIELCAKESDSFYLYDEDIIAKSIKELRDNFPEIEFLYSIKCNPNMNVLKSIFSRQLGADAASAGEVRLASSLGLRPNQIFYSAPGKSKQDIEKSIDKAVIIADSINEIKMIQEVAECLNRVMKIGIRINPSFSFGGEGLQSSKFGIDEDQAEKFIKSNNCTNIKIVGIHVHLRSQVLDVEALSTYYKRIFRMAERFMSSLGALEYINMGSGMGIQYAPTDLELDMSALRESVKSKLAAFRSAYPDTRIMIEVGRYAVCKSGIYITRVMDKKISCGKTYLILKNTLNGFIRPSLARLVEHYSAEESPSGSEPLFTCKNAFDFIPLKKSEVTEKVSLVGNLCTSTDVVAEDIILPQLEIGDLIAITNAGSYAAALSPMQFSTQEKPKEFFIAESGKVLSDN